MNTVEVHQILQHSLRIMQQLERTLNESSKKLEFQFQVIVQLQTATIVTINPKYSMNGNEIFNRIIKYCCPGFKGSKFPHKTMQRLRNYHPTHWKNDRISDASWLNLKHWIVMKLECVERKNAGL